MKGRSVCAVSLVIFQMLLAPGGFAQERKEGGGSVYDKYPLVEPIGGEEETEDFEKTYELYKQMFSEEGGKLRVSAYGELAAMRGARRLRHLPPANDQGFNFARRLVPNGPGETGPNGCAWV